MMNLRSQEEPWHFDKRIPLALIGTILVQTGAAFWWASSINERVAALESWRHDTKGLSAEIAVVQSQMLDVRAIVGRIEAKLAEPKP